MIVTGVILLACALLCLPSLISRKTADGEKLLEKIIVVQGILGIVIFLWSFIMIFNILIISSGAMIKENGILYWATHSCAYMIMLSLGFIFVFGFLHKTLSAKVPRNKQNKAYLLYGKSIELQTSLGFLCMLVGIWIIIYDTVIYPLIKI